MDFKGSHFEKEIIRGGVRWYVAYPLSDRQLEEMMKERGVSVEHFTLNRWVLKYAPEIAKHFRLRKRPVGRSWRREETYVRVKGQGKYLYRAVLRSVPSKWRRARDEGQRRERSLITWTL
jgi:putative transposase